MSAEQAPETFAAKKAAAVVKAEKALATAKERLEKALSEYGDEVARHEQRGDGFFPRSYLAARKEAVLARKSYESRIGQLNTARFEAAAPTIDPEVVGL